MNVERLKSERGKYSTVFKKEMKEKEEYEDWKLNRNSKIKKKLAPS